MSLSFNCGQYEQAFNSKKLQNWESRNHHRQRPAVNEGFTQIAANDRGHLLPSVTRSLKCPWGSFVGTWDLPKKLPGHKSANSTGRSTDSHYKNVMVKSDADAVIYGHTKQRRAKAGQPVEAVPPNAPSNAHIISERSGAANPIVKGTPNRQTLQQQMITSPIQQLPPTHQYLSSPPMQEMIHPELTKTPQPVSPTPGPERIITPKAATPQREYAPVM